MTSISITRHGEARMSQRGIRKSDIDTLLAHGTEVSPDRFMLRKRDADRQSRGLKKQIATLERLTGKVAVVADGLLITAYHRTKPGRPAGQKTGRRRRDGDRR